jgi:hypothetical protein
MGHTTEFSFKIKLRKDIPNDVFEFISGLMEYDDNLQHYLVSEQCNVPIDGDTNRLLYQSAKYHPNRKYENISHPFFECTRWWHILCSKQGNGNDGVFYKNAHYWTIDIFVDFKDYDNEIEKFLNWILPFIAGRKKKQYIGWSCYDKWAQRVYYHADLSSDIRKLSFETVAKFS